VKIVASDEVRRFIQDHGGDLYVWTKGHGCCQNVALLDADTRRPRGWREGPRPIDAGGFRLFLRTGARLPDELLLELKDRRRTVRAFWDGCAFVV
jgi:hypothetical protein